MYKGMTIEELINSVERAEQHAREEQRVKSDLRNFLVRMEQRELGQQELVEVA